MRSRILVVDGHNRSQTAAVTLLERQGHEILEAAGLEDALNASKTATPDLIFLNWTDSATTSNELRRLQSNGATKESPIIVTAVDEEINEAVSALSLGADDLIRMPFDEPEFLARVEACLRRRHGHNSSEQLVAGPILLDKTVHCLLVDGAAVDLAPTEFRLLAFFLEHQGRVFSRDELLKGAWTRNLSAGPRTVDVHVRRLRQLLEPFGCDDMIQTVRSFGYRFSPGNSSSAAAASENGRGRHASTSR